MFRDLFGLRKWVVIVVFSTTSYSSQVVFVNRHSKKTKSINTDVKFRQGQMVSNRRVKKIFFE